MAKKFLTGGAALALSVVTALAVQVAPANAVVWTSLLEYRDTGASTPSYSSTPYGTVTIKDGLDSGFSDGNHVLVSVSLTNAKSLFINTGGPHDPFLYNTVSGTTVTILDPVGSFRPGGHGSFEATPFGDLTDKIACCSTYVPETTVVSGSHFETQTTTQQVLSGYQISGYQISGYPVIGYQIKGYNKKGEPIYDKSKPIYDYAHPIYDYHKPIYDYTKPIYTTETTTKKIKVDDYTTIPAHYEEKNGASAGQSGPLNFLVYDASGITFAGIDFKTDADGKLIYPLGGGDHFSSNDGGWWFTADIFDGASGLTYNVAARDATTVLPVIGVPEPAAWALMIVGFGTVGAVLRRRRAVSLAA